MFSNPNPHYFIVLSQSDSISAAAEKLHVSHQNLSKYIKNLEQEYRITLFTRMPRLKLTEAGEAMLETMRELAFSEENLLIRLEGIRHAKTGKLRVGAPEGRFRIVFPELLVRMKELYPQVRIEPVAALKNKKLSVFAASLPVCCGNSVKNCPHPDRLYHIISGYH